MNQEKLNDQAHIKVLWMDDNPSRTIDNEFFEAGIDAKSFTTAEDTVNEYLIHRGTYQAIILDMEGADGTVDEFSKAVKDFEQLLKKDLIPLYVLTSYTVNDIQYKLARGTIASFKLKDDVFYHKQLHLNDLIQRIKKDVVNESDWFRIYKKYEEAFGAFETGIFDVGYQDSLYRIIQCATGRSQDLTGLFNEMRQIYEMVFYKFMIFKLPEEYYYGKPEAGNRMPEELPRETKRNVTEFLKGKEIFVRRKDEDILERIRIKEGPVMSLVMADIFDRFMDILNKKSHYNTDPGNYLTYKDLNERLPHFFESTALLLIDLIIWARNEIQDQKRYSCQRIVPSVEAETGSSDLVPAAEEPLRPDEKRIELKISQNVRSKERPIVRVVENQGMFVSYNRCKNMNELIDWMSDKSDAYLNAVVRDAYEIVRFEF